MGNLTPAREAVPRILQKLFGGHSEKAAHYKQLCDGLNLENAHLTETVMGFQQTIDKLSQVNAEMNAELTQAQNKCQQHQDTIDEMTRQSVLRERKLSQRDRKSRYHWPLSGRVSTYE